ncbi:hypothetical protein GCM10023229_24380 [Flavisolibacter ginsenosidimutans]
MLLSFIKRFAVKKDLWKLDIEQLQTLYRDENKELENRLLSGSSWEDVSDLRHQIGELSTVIYKKLNASHFDHPAEKSRRNE